MFLSAFASIYASPASRAYYDRKRAQGQRHNQAAIGLARRRAKDHYAMLRDGAIRPAIGQRFALEDAAEAHRMLEAGETRGSSIFTIADR